MAEAGNSTNLPVPGGAAVIADNPWLRQVAVMVGIAASVALGVAVVLWSQAPNFAPLYGNLAEKDASQIMDALQQAGVEYRVDQATGLIMVPSAKMKEIRMKLAAQGLPNSTGLGFELLQQDTGFGTSQLVEKARYQQAMQGELARTIATIGAVQSARVHLAIPKQSVFVRKRQPPSASVALRLHSGRVLEEGQVDAIVHLVASSIPELEPGRVTVVDHKGRLLSGDAESREIKLSATQFEYTRRMEEHFRERIESLLVPIVGRDRVRAQVTADIDFTVTEQTQERYNPDQPSLRSEQVNEEQLRNAAAAGVPGALANQPPAAGQAPQQAAGAAAGNQADTINSSRQATRNFELDRVISHSRMSPLSLRRLSVAVVVDDIASVGADGNVVTRERTPEEIERLTDLVREAIGFDARRGDSVKVMNSSFLAPEPIADLPETPLWEQGWFLDIIKQVGGLILVLLLIFVVLRPTMKRLTATHAELAGEAGGDGEGARVQGPLGPDGKPLPAGDESLLLGSDGEPIHLPGGGRYENIMDAARQLVDEDPKRVAQLVKTWMGEAA